MTAPNAKSGVDRSHLFEEFTTEELWSEVMRRIGKHFSPRDGWPVGKMTDAQVTVTYSASDLVKHVPI